MGGRWPVHPRSWLQGSEDDGLAGSSIQRNVCHWVGEVGNLRDLSCNARIFLRFRSRRTDRPSFVFSKGVARFPVGFSPPRICRQRSGVTCFFRDVHEVVVFPRGLAADAGRPDALESEILPPCRNCMAQRKTCMSVPCASEEEGREKVRTGAPRQNNLRGQWMSRDRRPYS